MEDIEMPEMLKKEGKNRHINSPSTQLFNSRKQLRYKTCVPRPPRQILKQSFLVNSTYDNRISAVLNWRKLFSSILTSFCRDAGITGLQFLCRSKLRNIWALILAVVSLYCLHQCKSNVDVYLKYNVNTRITTKSLERLSFPAISICPARTQKRSTFSNLLFANEILTSFYSYSFNNWNENILQNTRSCNNYNNLSDQVKRMEQQKYDDFVNRNMPWENKKYFINFEDALLQCVWERGQIPCNHIFLNRATDIAMCFTFNPGREMAVFTTNTNTFTSGGYGINLSMYDEDVFQVKQNSNGLRLLLDVKQSEYCGTDAVKGGAGYIIQIHDINRTPTFLLYPSFYLSPGSDYSINIDPVNYQRQTEHLGRCSEFIPLYMAPNNTIYVLEHCYVQCVTEHILRVCKCYPPMVGAFASQILPRIKDIGINPGDVKPCLGSYFICLKGWSIKFLNETTINQLCPYCKQPCSETKYVYEKSALLLTTRNTATVSNSTDDWVKKNFIIANFAMKSSEVQFIVETQAFTMKDLLIYLGSNICLFLGMSFISTFEILFLILELLVAFCKCLVGKKKNAVYKIKYTRKLIGRSHVSPKKE